MKKINSKICLSVLICILMVATVALAACNQGYTLSFETNGGEVIEQMQFKAGKSVTPPTPQKEYFTFDGWYSDQQLTQPFEQFDKMPEGDVTVYAKWIASKSGKIKFVVNGGSEVEAITGVVGQTVPQVDEPTKAGYQFAGWYTDEDLTQLYVRGTFSEGTLTLYAKWSRDISNYAFVTFILNGVATEVAVAKGQSVSAPANEQNTECVWYTDEELTQQYDFDSVVNSDLTLYGLKQSVGLVFDGSAVVGYVGTGSMVYVPAKHGTQDVTAIAAGAFERNDDVQAVYLPASVSTIGDYAFYGCEYLVEINLTKSVTSLGKFAFAGCVRLTSHLDLDGLETLAESVFANCDWLTSVKLGEGLNEIGAYAFANCNSLTEVNVPASVQTIGDYAFTGCKQLNKVNVGSASQQSSLKQIGTGAFAQCAKLQTLSLYVANVPALGESVFDGTETQIYVPASVVENFKQAWTAVADQIAAIKEA